jgi:hypothetical protein
MSDKVRLGGIESNTCDAMQYKVDNAERWESKEYSYLDKGSCFIDVFVIWT